MWIEVSFNHRKLLIGTFYRPPNSPASALLSIETIGLAHDTNIKDTFITGDFNLDILKQGPKRKLENLCQQCNLSNLVNEPTNFTESSSSAIDVLITSRTQSIFLSGVGELFLGQDIRYHCPVFCVFDFKKTTAKSF